jgi:GNAT superfamily N-acetyltransferase
MFENAAQPTSAQSVVVETRDVFSRHAEELVRARYAPEMANRGFTWPATGVTPEDFRDREVIVARVDGVVAGRAILDAVFYPLAELENLEVAPAYRGRGVGAAIVGQAIETAARAGFLAIHAQTRCDNVAAHRVYAHQGFLPATRGEMLRAWRFLNLPALAQFLYDHPFALFDSRPGAGAREHILRWREPAGEDELAVTLTGGSCQRDSGGVGPGVGAVRLRSGPVCLTATAEGTAAARVEEAFPVRLTLVNEGEGELSGGFRLGLNAGFNIADGHSGGERFSLAAGDTLDRTLAIEIEPSFPAAVLGICAYPSVPVTVEFLLGDHTFWLAAQVQIEEGGR